MGRLREKAVAVRVLRPYVIEVTFNDGARREVDLEPELWGQVFEPLRDPEGVTIRLRNCPYHELSQDHRDLTCGMNVAWASGIVDGLGAQRLEAVLDPQPDACCVVFRGATGPVGSRTDRGTPR